MGLSCACSDFDPSEHDAWWEPGRRSLPEPGERCCECCAPLPAGEKAATILAHTVVEPPDLTGDPEPTEDDYEDDCGAYDDALDAWHARHGWDTDTERFVATEALRRCERCADLADAIEGMGYCMVPPGELADQHQEYVNDVAEHSTHPIRWKQDPDGVWHPRRELAEDRLVDAVGVAWRRSRYWLRYGWWIDLRWKVWPPIETRVMRALGYRWTYVGAPSHHAWTRPDPPWLREARGDRL